MKTFFSRALAICASAFLLASCAGFEWLEREPKPYGKHGMPTQVVVLPVANESQDMGAPLLIRYFLEKELKSKGFAVSIKSDEVDRELRQLGIVDGKQIDQSNIQQVGQYLKVGGSLQCRLLEFRQDLVTSRRTARAKFELISTQSGEVLWQREAEAEERGLVTIPMRGTLTEDWPEELLRSIAKSPAGKLPRKLVKEALQSLQH